MKEGREKGKEGREVRSKEERKIRGKGINEEVVKERLRKMGR